MGDKHLPKKSGYNIFTVPWGEGVWRDGGPPWKNTPLPPVNQLPGGWGWEAVNWGAPHYTSPLEREVGCTQGGVGWGVLTREWGLGQLTTPTPYLTLPHLTLGVGVGDGQPEGKENQRK